MSGTGSAERASDDAIRSPGGLALAVLLAALLSLLPLIPAVRTVLGVGVVDVAISMAAFVVMLLAGSFVYHRWPGSRAFAVWDQIETVLVQLAVLWLVYASGRGDSFFWLLAIVHAMIVGRYASHVVYNFVVFGGMPAVVAIGFAIGRHDLGAAVLSLGVGAIELYIYWLSLSVSRRLAAVDAERARLAAELADTRVHEERQRIAREIHDGIGADLAALDWRLRGLPQATALQHEVDELTGRLAHGTDELRTIVWALRTPSRRWTELVAYLRQRASELCGDTLALEVVDAGDGEVAERPGELALDYIRGVLEMVRNAVRHAGAAHVRIVLGSSAAGLAATIVDDGRGVPDDALTRDEGGLANLRHRIARMGGKVELATGITGTRIQIDIPTTAARGTIRDAL